MGAPYSEDLRLRVLAAVDGELSKTQVHRTFGVSRSTIDDWLKLRAETGGVEANTHYCRGRRPMLSDTSELRAFMQKHQGRTLAQLSVAWKQEQGQQVSVKTFHKTLKRLGYTRKKRATAIGSATLANEPLSSNSWRA